MLTSILWGKNKKFSEVKSEKCCTLYLPHRGDAHYHRKRSRSLLIKESVWLYLIQQSSHLTIQSNSQLLSTQDHLSMSSSFLVDLCFVLVCALSTPSSPVLHGRWASFLPKRRNHDSFEPVMVPFPLLVVGLGLDTQNIAGH